MDRVTASELEGRISSKKRQWAIVSGTWVMFVPHKERTFIFFFTDSDFTISVFILSLQSYHIIHNITWTGSAMNGCWSNVLLRVSKRTVVAVSGLFKAHTSLCNYTFLSLSQCLGISKCSSKAKNENFIFDWELFHIMAKINLWLTRHHNNHFIFIGLLILWGGNNSYSYCTDGEVKAEVR